MISLCFSATLGQAQEPDVARSTCIKSYQKLRNRFIWKTSLVPIAGMAGLTESAFLAIGWEYGGWFAFKNALGPLLPAAGYAFNTLIPTAALGGTLVLEGVAIGRLHQANRAYRLIKDLYGVGNGKILTKVVRRIQKKNPEISEEEIRATLLAADEDGSLCDGSWVSGKRGEKNRRTLRGQIALLRDVVAYFSETEEED